MKFIVISIYVSFIIKLILGSTSSSSSSGIKLVSFHMQYICTELNEIYGRKACINVHVVILRDYLGCLYLLLDNCYIRT